MKKQDNFVKEVVSFLKKLLVSRKQIEQMNRYLKGARTSHNVPYVIFMDYKKEQYYWII